MRRSYQDQGEDQSRPSVEKSGLFLLVSKTSVTRENRAKASQTQAAFLSFLSSLSLPVSVELSSNSVLVPPKDPGKSCSPWRRCSPVLFSGDLVRYLFYLLFSLVCFSIYRYLSVVKNSADDRWWTR
ncbi:hypothetical protein J5N97_010892 [Dioscorea zingiberensis]|uniref:Uncharacterized protein n=1 Tax=Dioscorea zingiberensis TaxID=325984 RepID=A0A9D5HP19_9LILI|nr:hypothetical protein J5N97_010892 [Dioscorea zingiberensis]